MNITENYIKKIINRLTPISKLQKKEFSIISAQNKKIVTNLRKLRDDALKRVKQKYNKLRGPKIKLVKDREIKAIKKNFEKEQSKVYKIAKKQKNKLKINFKKSKSLRKQQYDKVSPYVIGAAGVGSVGYLATKDHD